MSEFLADANETLLRLGNASNQAGWVQANFITVDTQAIAARADEAYVTAATAYARRAAAFPEDAGTPEERRQLTVLKNTLTVAGPSDPRKTAELTTIMARLGAAYGAGKYCPPGASRDDCLDVEAITKIMAENRDPARLREVWEGWHAIGAPMKDDYTRFVDLSNEGARELGFADTGVMWKSRYDMAPDAFAAESDRLWEQVRPLYLALHTHVRARLHGRYGDVVPADGPIPAHLLGNIWAQDWTNVYELVKPAPGSRGVPLDRVLAERKVTPVAMAKYGERFFTSLGFAPLPETFWERSLFVKPRDREVVCHASAWDVDNEQDVRIKMCIDPTAEDFTTIHHELGHNFYQREYAGLPLVLRDGANDGFHEAVGDTIGLSVTPEYLVQIGLIDKAPDASGDIPLLLERALDKVAFLPFGRFIDQWRWQVFSGAVTPDRYNQAWWDLRLRYQGIAPPGLRSETRFDPGAKYHVPSNTPYARYFLADILQFQFPAHGTAPSLLDLRERGGRRAPEAGARDGRIAPLAGRPRGAQRRAPPGRIGNGRVLRAAESLAGRAEPGTDNRVVASRRLPDSSAANACPADPDAAKLATSRRSIRCAAGRSSPQGRCVARVSTPATCDRAW